MTACTTCGKHIYPSRQVARRAARQIRGEGGPKMRVYQCGNWWHLTKAGAKATARLRKARAS